MFTPDGELREEFSDLVNAEAPSTTAQARPSGDALSEAQGPQGGSPMAPGPAPAATPTRGPIAEPPPEPAEEDEPTETGAGFQDLVGVLAQTASVYLQQASQRLDNRRELLEMARLHVDMLAVLKNKTRGNLQAPEAALLDDALRQLRMALVEVGG